VSHFICDNKNVGFLNFYVVSGVVSIRIRAGASHRESGGKKFVSHGVKGFFIKTNPENPPSKKDKTS
jgi:hypothetical protein